MTYLELRNLLRNDLLAESSTSYWSDDDLLNYLRRAAFEIAREYAFPTVVESINVASGARSFTLPANASIIQLNEVSFAGFKLTTAPLSVIAEYQAVGSLRFPRYYNMDPKRSSLEVFIAPPAHKAGVVTLEYVAVDNSLTATLGDEPWDGLFKGFHELVAYRAAVRAFEASLEDDRAQYMMQRSQSLMQALALFLGKTDVATAAVGQGVSAS
jgi:hypothetical protein